MTKDEALKLALEALGNTWTEPKSEQYEIEKKAITAIKEALAQPYPEYDRGFSNGWDKCAERQAVQPEQWTPEDTAYRPGGLPQPEQTHSQNPKFTMDEWAAHARKHQWRFDEEPVTGVTTLAQPVHPEQMARLGWQYVECPACGSEGARAFPKPEEQQSCDKQKPCKGKNCGSTNPKLHSAECFDEHESTIFNIKPFGYFEFVLDDGDGYWREIEGGGIDGKPLYTSPPQRQPLTDEEIQKLAASLMYTKLDYSLAFARAVEAKHGIGDKT